MTCSAPRIPQRLLDAIDRHGRTEDVPLAEIARRVCADAEQMGLTRPSYERVRKLVNESRGIRRRLHPVRKGLLLLQQDIRTDSPTRATVDELLRRLE